jgi:hypothetical protein
MEVEWENDVTAGRITRPRPRMVDRSTRRNNIEYQTWQGSAASTRDGATGVVHSRRRDLPMPQRGAGAHSSRWGPLPVGR